MDSSPAPPPVGTLAEVFFGLDITRFFPVSLFPKCVCEFVHTPNHVYLSLTLIGTSSVLWVLASPKLDGAEVEIDIDLHRCCEIEATHSKRGCYWQNIAEEDI